MPRKRNWRRGVWWKKKYNNAGGDDGITCRWCNHRPHNMGDQSALSRVWCDTSQQHNDYGTAETNSNQYGNSLNHNGIHTTKDTLRDTNPLQTEGNAVASKDINDSVAVKLEPRCTCMCDDESETNENSGTHESSHEDVGQQHDNVNNDFTHTESDVNDLNAVKPTSNQIRSVIRGRPRKKTNIIGTLGQSVAKVSQDHFRFKSAMEYRNPFNCPFLLGSTHQGSTQFSPASRGRQCTCIALTFLCISVNNTEYSSSNLDAMLYIGDTIYQQIVQQWPLRKRSSASMLLLNELPNSVTILPYHYVVASLHSYTGLVYTSTEVVNYTLRHALEAALAESSSCLLIVKTYCFACSRLRNSRFVLFDSYSHGFDGLISADGASILRYCFDLPELYSCVMLVLELLNVKADDPFELQSYGIKSVMCNNCVSDVPTDDNSNDCNITQWPGLSICPVFVSSSVTVQDHLNRLFWAQLTSRQRQAEIDDAMVRFVPVRRRVVFTKNQRKKMNMRERSNWMKVFELQRKKANFK